MSKISVIGVKEIRGRVIIDKDRMGRVVRVWVLVFILNEIECYRRVLWKGGI